MNYYINGDAAKADQIKAAFEAKGFIPRIAPMYYGSESVLFFTGIDNYIYETSSPWVMDIIITHPDYQELELPVEPKFKVGDTISTGKVHTTILQLDMDKQGYRCSDEWFVYFKNQDLWPLEPKPHYDIKNFKPFDKVLVRQNDSCTWGVSFFGRCSGGMFMCCTNIWFEQCIPFNEKTEHLLGTTDMPSEEYINW